jgi:hypothetical protein
MRREICGECGAPVNDDGACVCTELLKRGWRLCAKDQKTTQWCQMAEALKAENERLRVIYRLHHKLGNPDSVRVDYWCGLSRVASEWLCFGHEGLARKKAVRWWRERVPGVPPPSDAHEAIAMINEVQPRRPKAIVVRKFGKYPEIIEFVWGNHGDGNDEDAIRNHGAESASAVGIL